jgi:hypothetical protein
MIRLNEVNIEPEDDRAMCNGNDLYPMGKSFRKQSHDVTLNFTADDDGLADLAAALHRLMPSFSSKCASAGSHLPALPAVGSDGVIDGEFEER